MRVRNRLRVILMKGEESSVDYVNDMDEYKCNFFEINLFGISAFELFSTQSTNLIPNLKI